MKNQETRDLMKFFLNECQKLQKKRDAAGFDTKQEQGTYNQGYYEALLHISTKLINKTKLN